MPSNRGISDRLGEVDLDYEQHLRSVPANDDGPVWMVNLVRLRERADFGSGRDRGMTGQQAYDATEPSTTLDDIGAAVVFYGEASPAIDGTQAYWNRVTAVKYPTRRSFITAHRDPQIRTARQQKLAGLESTIVLACIPSPTMPVPAHLTVPAWNSVPHPATDEDGPVTVMHLIRYVEDHDEPEKMAKYAQALAAASVRHGARSTRWFAVESTVVGDGREWHDVRFTAYPSRAAFSAARQDLTNRPDYPAIQSEVIADRYTLVLRARIDRLVRSVSL